MRRLHASDVPSLEQFAERPRAETRFAVCTCPSASRCEIASAVGLVIFAKPLTQTPGLDADDGIGDGVECLGTIEDRQSDAIALQPLAAPRQSFIDDVLKEPLAAARLLKRAALEDAVQLVTNRLPVGFATAIGQHHNHA